MDVENENGDKDVVKDGIKESDKEESNLENFSPEKD